MHENDVNHRSNCRSNLSLSATTPSVESMGILCQDALRSQHLRGYIILHLCKCWVFFCGYSSPAFEKHGRSSVTFPQGQPLPRLPHPLNMGQRGCSDCSHWNSVGKCLHSYIPRGSQIQDLATVASYSAGSRVSAPPPLHHLHSDLALLSSLSTPAMIHTLRTSHTQGFSPYLGLYCRVEQGNSNHSLQLSLQLCGTWSSSASDRGWQNVGKSSWTASALSLKLQSNLMFPLVLWEADARYLVMQEREFNVLWTIFLPKKLEEIKLAEGAYHGIFRGFQPKPKLSYRNCLGRATAWQLRLLSKALCYKL